MSKSWNESAPTCLATHQPATDEAWTRAITAPASPEQPEEEGHASCWLDLERAIAQAPRVNAAGERRHLRAAEHRANRRSREQPAVGDIARPRGSIDGCVDLASADRATFVLRAADDGEDQRNGRRGEVEPGFTGARSSAVDDGSLSVEMEAPLGNRAFDRLRTHPIGRARRHFVAASIARLRRARRHASQAS